MYQTWDKLLFMHWPVPGSNLSFALALVPDPAAVLVFHDGRRSEFVASAGEAAAAQPGCGAKGRHMAFKANIVSKSLLKFFK